MAELRARCHRPLHQIDGYEWIRWTSTSPPGREFLASTNSSGPCLALNNIGPDASKHTVEYLSPNRKRTGPFRGSAKGTEISSADWFSDSGASFNARVKPLSRKSHPRSHASSPRRADYLPPMTEG
uniref:Alpha-amylase_C domain-containing protein n=1 Tax=Mesocestoides corti TaxID=53468 RepID=A0A5K3G1Y5_MESCO